MHDAVGDQFGAVVIPAHGARRRMGGRRGELFQPEDGHGGSGELGGEAINHTPGEVNETLNLARNRVLSMKLDFRPPIATFRIAFRPLASVIVEPFIPAWPPVFPKSSRKRGCPRGRCWITATTCSIRRCGSASPDCRAPARPCSSPRWFTASRAAAAFRCSSRSPPGGSPAPGWSRSPTTRCRASPMKITSAP